MRCVPEQLVARGRHDRPLDCGPEEQLELRRRRRKVGLRCEREVELQRARHEEDAVDRRAGGKVEEDGGVELVDDRARKVLEHPGHRFVLGDAERQVEV